jgi:hypothetical protein
VSTEQTSLTPGNNGPPRANRPGSAWNSAALAIVLSVDEKTQVQVLDCTQTILPLQPALVERRTHDYTRDGTLSLFAALEEQMATLSTVTLAAEPHRVHVTAEFS